MLTLPVRLEQYHQWENEKKLFSYLKMNLFRTLHTPLRNYFRIIDFFSLLLFHFRVYVPFLYCSPAHNGANDVWTEAGIGEFHSIGRPSFLVDISQLTTQSCHYCTEEIITSTFSRVSSSSTCEWMSLSMGNQKHLENTSSLFRFFFFWEEEDVYVRQLYWHENIECWPSGLLGFIWTWINTRQFQIPTKSSINHFSWDKVEIEERRNCFTMFSCCCCSCGMRKFDFV